MITLPLNDAEEQPIMVMTTASLYRNNYLSDYLPNHVTHSNKSGTKKSIFQDLCVHTLLLISINLKD